MGYAVRPLRRSGQHKAKARAVRHRSYWVPAGGSLQYTVTDSLPTIEIGNTTIVTFSTGIASAGGFPRPMMRGLRTGVR